MAASFYADPAFVALAQTFLNTSSNSLSALQKDIYSTYLTVAQDLVFLKRFLGDAGKINGRDLERRS